MFGLILIDETEVTIQGMSNERVNRRKYGRNLTNNHTDNHET